MSLLSSFVFGNENFGLTFDEFHPALYILNYPIYLYALCIVSGMCLAIALTSYYFKKRGIDPYDSTVYALAIIPLGVLGARCYVYIFPWNGGETSLSAWSTFFNFRSGGLGIYGGIIVGYVTTFVVSKIRRQDYGLVVDCILPGVMLAQSMGRWGNFFNQEAYGNLITTDYNALPNFFEGIVGGPRHGFNGYAVWIDNWHASGPAGWYQATFFYENFCTFVGFLICLLVLTRNKHYKIGWCTAFYGIYYGIVRLVIEGMRSDSLYLYLGNTQTDIKISQLVSIFAIVMGCWLLTKIYRKQLHSLYKKILSKTLLKNVTNTVVDQPICDYDEIRVSKYVLGVVAFALYAFSILAFNKGGESNFLVGLALLVVAVYSTLGVWSLFDRQKVYCHNCKKLIVTCDHWQTDYQKYLIQTVVYSVAVVLLIGFATFSLLYWGLMCDLANGVVLAVVCYALAVVIAVSLLSRSLRSLANSKKMTTQPSVCSCGQVSTSKLNTFLLFVFPPKVYRNYGVEDLQPWVDPEKITK